MKALRKSLFSALGLAVLVGVLVPSGSDAFHRFGLFFGRKVAGSYMGMVALPPGSAPLPTLFTFHRERTATFSSPSGNASLAHGTWIPTGHNTIEGTFVELLYDTEGFLVQIAVFTFAQEFMNHFKTFEAKGDITVFACPPDSMGNPVCPNPFDPNTAPIFGGPFTVTAQRIKAVQN